MSKLKKQNSFRGWSFDPAKPNVVPEAVIPCLERRGIDKDTVKLLIKTDMNRDCVLCDNYIIVTDTDIMIISGSVSIKRKENLKPLRAVSTNPLTSEFEELSYDFHNISELADFAVEELLSTARLTAKVKGANTDEGSEKAAEAPSANEHILIANMSNSYKQTGYTFVKYMKQLIEKGEITPDTEDGNKDDIFCPKCGNRYADRERKVCPKCMDKGKIIRRTGVFFLKYKVKIAIVAAMLVITSALGIIGPYVNSGFYYDEVLDKAGKFYGQIFLVLGIVLSTRILSLLINIVHSIITSVIAANLVYDLKKVIFTAIERLSISFFTGRQTGGLMTQVTRDANTIYWFFCDGVPYFLVNMVQAVAIIVIMVILNPMLSLLSLVTVPLVVVGILAVFGRMDELHSKNWSRSRKMNSILSDVLTGMRVVKAFSKEKDEISRFDKSSQDVAEASKKLGMFANIAFPAINFLLYASNIIVWGVGGWMVIQGKMEYGMLLTFVAYMNMIYGPMYMVIDMVYMTTDSLNAMSRLIEVMDAKSDIVEKEDPVRLDSETFSGKVEFKNVSFSYVKNRKVIDDVSFEIEPGKVIGIVGHTGAGKSTLTNLLIRLYDVEDGEILIDDINIKDIAFDDLRRNVSIVSQETYLFMGTIMENIMYANPDASHDEVVEASKIAGAHDFIMKLPDAYSTKIGFGFKDLSGGERQRISIARAILRNPKILIMDEATAAMDTETERQIQTALERLVVGRTTIMIAHRLSTLRDADKLIVIENGKMPEFGTHLELLNQKGIYFKLYKLQAEALKNIGIES